MLFWFFQHCSSFVAALLACLVPWRPKCVCEFATHLKPDMREPKAAHLSSKGSGAPEPFLYRCALAFVLKLVQKWTWNSRAIFNQTCLWICIEIGTEMDLEFQSRYWTDVRLSPPACLVSRFHNCVANSQTQFGRHGTKHASNAATKLEQCWKNQKSIEKTFFFANHMRFYWFSLRFIAFLFEKH